MTDEALRIALLSYRGHPQVGGQGVYVRYLSRALARQGHSVTVFAGQPYPELDEGIRFVAVPSLDLYRPEDPFRRPRLEELRGPVDVLEYAAMCTAAFPEPLTFSLRVASALRARPGTFDIVHDNQCLGYGLLEVARHVPVVATVHHPVSVDRRLAVARAGGPAERFRQRRWYSFVRMQARVARRLKRIVAVSEAGRRDVIAEFGVTPALVGVVPNGVDTDLFRLLPGPRAVPGRVIAVASSDLPLKGLPVLVEAVAKLATERQIELVLVGRGGTGRAVRDAVARFGVAGIVRIEGRVEVLDMVELYSSAQVAVVPSLYEGFSLPAVEAMSTGTAVVATESGAIPEAIGPDGSAGLLVPPGDAGAMAAAIGTLLDDDARRERLGRAGRQRALRLFSWDRAACAMVDEYRRVVTPC